MHAISWCRNRDIGTCRGCRSQVRAASVEEGQCVARVRPYQLQPDKLFLQPAKFIVDLLAHLELMFAEVG